MSSSCYSADKICKSLWDSLPKTGKIHSIFENALNIQSGELLITVVPKGKPLYPNAVCLTEPLCFTALSLEQGMPVQLTQSEMNFGALTISLTPARVVSLSLFDRQDLQYPNDLEQRLDCIKEVLWKEGKTEGLSPLLFQEGQRIMPDNPYTAFLRQRIAHLLQTVKAQDYTAMVACAPGIAGCGMGLTPSSDDFLCGFMAALLAKAQSQGEDTASMKQLFDSIAKVAASKTNFISAAFLKSSAIGQLSEDTLLLLQVLFSKGSLTACKSAASNVAKFGATSGTDILCGIYLALS